MSEGSEDDDNGSEVSSTVGGLVVDRNGFFGGDQYSLEP